MHATKATPKVKKRSLASILKVCSSLKKLLASARGEERDQTFIDHHRMSRRSK
jgi:hypothetical protein